MSLTFEGDGTITGFDAGLSGFGGLVAVKHAIFTGTQSASVAAGGNVAVTDLSITHEVADANNKLIMMGMIGNYGSSLDLQVGGLAVAVDGTLVNIGTSLGSRTGTTSANQQGAVAGVVDAGYANLNLTYVYTPGSGSKTYTLNMVNTTATTNILYVNRRERDDNNANDPRGVSSLVIMEVAV